jgi:hypothetical protein
MRAAIASYAAIDLDPPQYNYDGRHKRGHYQQVLQGSDPHFTLRFPSPTSGVVDSLPNLQLLGHNRLNITQRLCLAEHRFRPYRSDCATYRRVGPTAGCKLRKAERGFDDSGSEKTPQYDQAESPTRESSEVPARQLGSRVPRLRRGVSCSSVDEGRTNSPLSSLTTPRTVRSTMTS